uniref:Ras family GTPase n=1 Tax=Pithovirus LCPAC401 TaxID=2506595 RepID=A0A481Z964_9VIRU|nr:MAG: Ras family GTPase [Pithovirus LCPAC401]
MGERKPQYKICLIGPSQSGKTRYVNGLLGLSGRMGYVDRILNQCENYEDYSTTLGVEVNPLEREECIINFWDIGSTKVGFGDGYTIGCSGILQFHDEDDNPPPFEPPQGVPIVHIYYEDGSDDPLQTLIEMIEI